MSDNKDINELRLLKEFLKYRLAKPSKSVGFWIYFIVIVIVVGLTGSMLSIISSKYIDTTRMDDLSLSIIGYSIVLLCASSVDLVFIKLSGEEKRKFHQVQGALKMIGICLLMYSIVACIIPFHLNPIGSLIFSIISAIISLVLWWITNGYFHKKYFGGDENSDAFTGGSTKRPLPGDLTGYKVG